MRQGGIYFCQMLVVCCSLRFNANRNSILHDKVGGGEGRKTHLCTFLEPNDFLKIIIPN